ncbi:MAG TPA: LysR family transcriptional regulator [Chloroflexaceae bacterium]|nr:LysR family transcriptional regulator [Chloroflexaceae bacterium]
MDAQKLTYFLAAAHTQNFRRAAELCHVAQPVLSRQIAALEQDLGVELFERDRRKVALTPAGTAFIAHARAILDRIQEGRQAMAARRDDLGGTLTVGCIEPLSDTLLPPAFAAFHRRHPLARVSVTVSGTEELFEQVERGGLELGLFGLAPERMRANPLLVVHELYHDRLALLVAGDHPLARGAASVGVGQLFDEPMALLNQRFAMRRILERIFAQHSRVLAPALDIDNVATLKLIVKEGGVSTVLPQSLLAAADRKAGMVALPIHDLREVFTFALVYRQVPALSPAAEAFIEAVAASLEPTRPAGVGG